MRVVPMRVACCAMRVAPMLVACSVLHNRRNACCAMRVACCLMRVAFCAIAAMRVAPMLVAAFSLFFLKRKDTEGSRESGSDAGGTCRSLRREGKKGRGEERKGNGKRAAGARTYL